MDKLDLYNKCNEVWGAKDGNAMPFVKDSMAGKLQTKVPSLSSILRPRIEGSWQSLCSFACMELHGVSVSIEGRVVCLWQFGAALQVWLIVPGLVSTLSDVGG